MKTEKINNREIEEKELRELMGKVIYVVHLRDTLQETLNTFKKRKQEFPEKFQEGTSYDRAFLVVQKTHENGVTELDKIIESERKELKKLYIKNKLGKTMSLDTLIFEEIEKEYKV